jgi:outer membrane receptor protein involved in Fe transport
MPVRITRFASRCVSGALTLLLMTTRLLTAAALPPAEPSPKHFDLPRGDATESLTRFAAASGEQVVFLVDTVRGVTTNAVRGTFTPRAALARMLEGTPLRAVHDSGSGALLVRRLAATASESPLNGGNGTKPRSLAALVAGWLTLLVAPATPGSAAEASASGAGAAGATAGSAVVLSPFEVAGERDLGYQSTATLSGTRTGELLRNLPVSVSIINQELLNDVGATDVMQAMALYGVGVEQTGEPGIGLAGIGGGGNSLNFRGIQSSWQGRDGFVWYGVSDSYNVESLEVSRGPSGNVFGDSRAGGLPNIVSKRAKPDRNFGNLNLRWDSEGGTRATLDWNRQLTKKAAVRLNLLKADGRDWRDTTFDRRQGLGAAVQYDFTRATRLSVVGEYNNVGRHPTQGLYTNNYDSGYVLGTGSNAAGPAPAGTAVLQAAGVMQRWTLLGGQLVNFTSTPTYLSRQTTVPGNQQNAVPLEIIPRHMLWNGPSHRLDHDSKSLTVNLDHRFGPNTVVQGTYNLTLSDRFDNNVGVDGVRREVNPTLRTSTGALVPNPNFDQLFVEHRLTQNQYYNRTASYRLTAVQDLDLRFTRQRVILNGSIRDDRFRLFNRAEFLTPSTIASYGFTGAAAQPINHPVRYRHYLRDGNDGTIRHRGDPSFYFPETTGGQKTRAFFYSASALLFGKYWQDRIMTTVGIRRDDYESRRVAIVADPVTGLGRLETGASNDEQWREQLGVFGTSINYGVVFSPQRWWRAFYNYAENFQQNGTNPYFNGDSREARIGDGFDYGASLYLWDNRFAVTVTRFDNKANNENLTALNLEVAEEINRLLGTSYNTGTPQDTQSRRATGTEVELVASLRPITLRFAYSMRKNVNTDFAPRLASTLALMKSRTSDSSLYALTEQRYDSLLVENPSARASWNYSVRYDLTKGPLKGGRFGSYGSYRQGRWVYPAGRPALYFKSYIPIGVFASYGWKMGDRFRPEIQLNIDNVLDDQTRIGGGYTGYSYVAPRKYTVSTTLRF